MKIILSDRYPHLLFDLPISATCVRKICPVSPIIFPPFFQEYAPHSCSCSRSIPPHLLLHPAVCSLTYSCILEYAPSSALASRSMLPPLLLHPGVCPSPALASKIMPPHLLLHPRVCPLLCSCIQEYTPSTALACRSIPHQLLLNPGDPLNCSCIQE